MSDTRPQPDETGKPLSGAAALFARQREATDPATGRRRYRFTADAGFCNPIGVVQGGLLMAMMELALTDHIAADVAPGTQVRLIDLQTSFLRAAIPGALICDVGTTRLGRRTAFAAAELRDSDGALLATGNGVLALEAGGR